MSGLYFSAALEDGVKSEKNIIQITHTTSKDSFLLVERDIRFVFDLFNDYMQGILVLSRTGDIMYVNKPGQIVLEEMNGAQADYPCLPREIRHLFQFQSNISHHFPHQNWSVTTKISTNTYDFFDIQTRWIHVRSSDSDCLLFVMEDTNQRIQEIVIKEARHYGLTPRETDVWLLHKSHYTYKQIAKRLNIMPNTVKKHMKNILTKQRLASEKPD